MQYISFWLFLFLPSAPGNLVVQFLVGVTSPVTLLVGGKMSPSGLCPTPPASGPREEVHVCWDLPLPAGQGLRHCCCCCPPCCLRVTAMAPYREIPETTVPSRLPKLLGQKLFRWPPCSSLPWAPSHPPPLQHHTLPRRSLHYPASGYLPHLRRSSFCGLAPHFRMEAYSPPITLPCFRG